MLQHFSDYQAPPVEEHRQGYVTITSDRGELVLRPNQLGYGFKLTENSEGFGPGEVENEITPRLDERGATLGKQRETEGDMVLALTISSTSNTEVKRLTADLHKALKPAQGTSRVAMVDPLTGVGRYRDVAYRSGLETPVWTSPTIRKYDIVVDYLDPWAYSTSEGRTRIGVVAQRLGTGFRAPLRAPVRSSLAGGEPRAGVIRSEGEQPAPVRVVFHGPCSNPRVWGGGFEAGYRGRLAHDETVVLDGMARTVVLRTPDFPTRHVPGLVTRRTRIAKLSVPPGVTNLWFDAQDPTGTSFVEMFWSDAFASMQ